MTIPRQIENLRTFRYFYQQLTNARIFRTRFDAAVRNSQLDEVDLIRLVQLERVSIDGETFATVDDVVTWLGTKGTGRVVIRGANGTGKSSLLLALHQKFAASLYLPPVADFELGVPNPDESTGQRMLRQLKFFGESGEPILLLDEWDANLDADRRDEVERTLDQLARGCLVVEVRHHAPGGCRS